jgi:hypothetical protein
MGASTRAYEDDIRPSCSAADLARLHALDSQAKQPGMGNRDLLQRLGEVEIKAIQWEAMYLKANEECRELRAALHSVKVSPE